MVTAVTTYLGFRRRDLFDRYCFRPERVLAHREWYRLLSSGFLHGDWMHFGFNALSLYIFGRGLEESYGPGILLVIYLGSIVGGDLVALYFHRNHAYTSMGASGGVCGVIFATLFLLPGTRIILFPLPVGIPAWLYAILFMVGIYLGKRRNDGIGHDAHFGGALVGVLLALALYPDIVLDQKYLLGGVLVLSLGLLWVQVRDPRISAGAIWTFGDEKPKPSLRYQDYDHVRAANEAKARVDGLLEKISRQGLHSLTAQERTVLEQYSRTKQRRG